MNKVKIAVSDLVCYRSDAGNQILGRVRKVNRVNSKVQIWAINGRIVWRPDPVTVYKAYLRRAGPGMVALANEFEF